MKRSYLTVMLFAGLSLGSVANAAVIWNFTSGVTQNTDLASSQAFTSTGGSPNFTITAYGVHTDGSATDLYAKSSGDPTETGLGLDHGSEFEIDNEGTGHAIELDVSSLPNATTLQFLITSVQSSETFDWKTANTSATEALSSFSTTNGGATGLTESGSTVEKTFSFTRDSAAHEFIAISVSDTNGADVLLSSATITSGGGQTTTPEPRFYGLLLVSLLAIPAIRRRFVPQQ